MGDTPLCSARPWIPGCPLWCPPHDGPLYPHRVLYSLTSGVSHTQGRETAQGPPSPSGVHPQPPSTCTRQARTPQGQLPGNRGQPRSPRSGGITGAGRSKLCGLPCPALAAQIPRPGLPTCLPALVPRWVEARCTGARPQSLLQDQAARAPGPSTEALLASHAAEPLQGLTSATAWPGCDLAVAAFLRAQGAHEGPRRIPPPCPPGCHTPSGPG